MNRVELTTAIFREVAIIQERMDVILKNNLPPELPRSQFTLLNHLIYTTNIDETSSDLANNFQVSLSAMSQVIKQLRNKGYIVLQIRSADARKKSIIITDEGRTAHSEAMKNIDIDIKSFSAKFSLKDMQQLYELSHQYRILFEKHTQ